MEEKHQLAKFLGPILKLCLNPQELQNLENIQPDVEYKLLSSMELYKHKKFEQCIGNLDNIIDLTWEELNTGHWSLVPEAHRRVYAAASLLKVVALVHQDIQSITNSMHRNLEDAVKTADLGLMLGNCYREQLSEAAHILSEALNKYKPKLEAIPTISADSYNTLTIKVPTQPVCELHCPSLETFSSQHFYPRIPLKITGCMNHWSALKRWTDLSYLIESAGSRTVPVELGSSYSESNWSQKLMSLRDFVTQHVLTHSSAEGKGYLAQHQLFDQIPELKKDIAVPDYCACSEAEGEEESEVDINAWFGPSGTVSTLHFDPKHNLLCQAVGRKQVTLYAPSSSDHLYPYEGMLLSNTAQVDPEAPDYKMFPKYRNTEAFLCILSPGEMLYIPPLWWHHVRSLDISFSVSFWWT